jgi:hypothetical protein
MRILPTLVILAACHRAPTPEQAAAQIQALSTRACECKTAACVDADVKQIEDLMDSIDFKRLGDPASDGMGGYAHALGCQAQLEPR